MSHWMANLAVALLLTSGLTGAGLGLAARAGLSTAALWRIARMMSLLLLGAGAGLVVGAAGGTLATVSLGDWRPPFGIVLVIDRLASLFVLLLTVLLAAVAWVLRPDTYGERTVRRLLPLLFLLGFGLIGAFLTGDLFNLFVMFELVLLVSYAMLAIPGGRRAVRAAFPTIAINLVASALFFVGVGLLYSIAGTVQIAGLAVALEHADPALVLAAITLLAVAFAVKAGLLPAVFWLPASYPVLSGPVAALFAGIMTKLGVYALLRTVPLLMKGTPLPSALLWIGGASALLGVLAAYGQTELRRLLGFHIVSQVGTMVLGLGLATVAGIAGAVFYLVHHILVKAALFLVADRLERLSGSRDLGRMAGLAAPGGALAVAFALAAASLSGLPPLSGFVAKLGLFRAAAEVESWAVLTVLAVGAVLTLASMLKVWSAVFASGGRRRRRVGAPLALLVAASLAVAVLARPVYDYALDTARQLQDREGWAAAVGAASGRPQAEEVPR